MTQASVTSSGRARALIIAALAAPALYLLYFLGLTRMGLLGPDEPRYAAIGREMARSGDWITPRLWGAPWFEKPALLYWMTGAAFRLGLGDDLAPRLPVAVCSVGFLLFFYWIVWRQFGQRPALFATAILATSAGWLSYSASGVTDLPMSAAFSAAMLLSLDWLQRGERRWLPAAAAFLGLAVLAKGLTPVVLALPLALAPLKRLTNLFRPAVLGAFFIVALPWYLLCFFRNGGRFLQTFFWEHHVERFTSTALQHRQPFWFFGPVLLLFLFPWTPALLLLFHKSHYHDSRRSFLALWIVWGIAFFSLSANKLPGYILPLLPAVSILLGLALAEAEPRRLVWILVACGVLLALIPIGAQILPQALAGGLSRARAPHFEWACVVLGLAGPAAAYIEYSGRRSGAVGLLICAAIAGVVFLKIAAYPSIDRAASARPVWRQIAPNRERVCLAGVSRNWRYGLNYYSIDPLPDCEQTPRELELVGTPGQPPSLQIR